MYIVMMAGGMGTRFWPLSRSAFPKQLLNLVGDRSMLQQTYDRVKGLTENDKILVITSAELKDQVIDQLPELPEENIFAEPFGRNTAPCIGLAAAIINKRQSGDETMVVLPADHLINDTENFRDTLKIAARYAARQNCLITIGIKPDYPETGYGYIQRGTLLAEVGTKHIYKVKTFAEKPQLEIAQQFLKSGDFLWNSGIFVWQTKTIMNEFEEHQIEMYEGFKNIEKAVDSSRMDNVIHDEYSRMRNISIDYAIMEQARHVCVIAADFFWNDVGSWQAAYNISEKDEHQNAANCERTVLVDSRGNYIYAKDKLVALADVENLVIVDTGDVLLICKKDQSQRVRDLVDALRRKKYNEYL